MENYENSLVLQSRFESDTLGTRATSIEILQQNSQWSYIIGYLGTVPSNELF
jgi:hypothetical protein